MSVEKRKKNYFHNFGNKKQKPFILEPGMKGFLCTCNFSEKECIRDAYKILNEFSDEIYGSDIMKVSDRDNAKLSPGEKDDDINKAEQSDGEDDISTALNKEINKLKAEHLKPVNARRFQVVHTGVKNVVFIRTTLENPVELVSKIVTEMHKTKQQRTRFLLRLLPIEIVCKANMNDIKLKADALLEKYFAQEPKTFSIVFNRHSNKTIRRGDVIEDLADIITKKNPGNKADLKNPELAVIVEVIRGTCLMCVAPDYYKFRKYNLIEICNSKQATNDDKKAVTASSEPEKETECDAMNVEAEESLNEEDTVTEKATDHDAEIND
ncbi:THUMP domain-containing protein 1 homolog [Ceratina calcarata]|uniref:THUMP domain-containing protein 1 homolog n=1 Tax=Ceratina calcarata TaxID=156304 RepID=A0AAJ7J9P8_9HYME|nr:THUMP domain-containing protein 1 homolog [Ceratina calcarata]